MVHAATPDAGTVLVLGATGQVGRFALARLVAARWRVIAVTRGAPPVDLAASPAITWRTGDLDGEMPADAVDAIASCGPLDAASRWFARSPDRVPARVVALSSTSVHVKAASPDPAERDVATRLARAESSLAALAATHAVTILRPTLIYGAGTDRTLARIGAIARRTGVAILPRGARGMRQPVHADDLAAALVASLARATPGLAAYDLPGGETLHYDEMVARSLRATAPRARVVRVPDALFGAAARVARALGVMQALTPAIIARMHDDLVFDAGPARDALGYAPRPFDP